MIDLPAVYSQGLQPVVFLAINKTHGKKKLNFHENRVCIGKKDLLRFILEERLIKKKIKQQALMKDEISW